MFSLIDISEIGECVECGSHNLRSAKRDIKVKRLNPGEVIANNQPCIECVECGELYLDEVQGAITAHILDAKANEETPAL